MKSETKRTVSLLSTRVNLYFCQFTSRQVLLPRLGAGKNRNFYQMPLVKWQTARIDVFFFVSFQKRSELKETLGIIIVICGARIIMFHNPQKRV